LSGQNRRNHAGRLPKAYRTEPCSFAEDGGHSVPVADLLIGDILLGVGLPLATFALRKAMAGFAGVLVAPVFAIDPQLGSRFTIEAFAVIIVGGTAVIPARSHRCADRELQSRQRCQLARPRRRRRGLL
jgi:hypothetical protein